MRKSVVQGYTLNILLFKKQSCYENEIIKESYCVHMQEYA